MENENSYPGCPVDYSGLHSSGPITDEERRQLEHKLALKLEWVGVWVPDYIVLEGSRVPLHETLWNLVKKTRLSQDEEALLLDLEDKLSLKYREDLTKIDKTDTRREQAIRDYCEAAGLLRAIGTLKGIESGEEAALGKDELAREMNEARKMQARRWLDYLKQLEGP
jgi:hypothetical protein